ncbi:MAG: type IVB secretion system protein IcmH/DotU [Vicinamibacterales bacterium]|nr:type IVB secretion system protein IcmH/DotU [Vicinamibacterales bacterium]
MLGAGLNPLVQIASPLLLLAGRQRGTVAAPDVEGLKRGALEEIRRFEKRAQASGIGNDVVVAARYALCAGLDEAVLSTPWGAQSEWAHQTLLVVLHGEASGGEKFFQVLKGLSDTPARHLDLLELYYLCLAFGFVGKYETLDRGRAQLADVQRDLYGKIRAHRGAPETELSLRWRGEEDRRNPIIRYIPWWVVGAFVLAVLVVTYSFFAILLGGRANPVHVELASVGLEDFTPRPRPPEVTPGPTLKELLAPEEARELVSIEEEGAITRITLLASDLFASASATVAAAHVGTLSRITDALNQVPGNVLVEGHTDDEPYEDNFGLSRRRAIGVASIIQDTIDYTGRVTPVAKGASEPRYLPPSTPENRARNRRVEIVHSLPS